MKAQEGQGFWYIKHQGVDEVWLLKQYDSYAAIPEGKEARIAPCRHLSSQDLVMLTRK